jgi:hypothetical protein
VEALARERLTMVGQQLLEERRPGLHRADVEDDPRGSRAGL